MLSTYISHLIFCRENIDTPSQNSKETQLQEGGNLAIEDF